MYGFGGSFGFGMGFGWIFWLQKLIDSRKCVERFIAPRGESRIQLPRVLSFKPEE